MNYISKYRSPLGEITLSSDEIGLTGLWLPMQKHDVFTDLGAAQSNPNQFIQAAKNWLDIYFRGEDPSFKIPLHFIGTEFQKSVWAILRTIPYGTTMTYGDIAKTLARQNGLRKMSAQAVGGAVGHNRISIIVPCHRVIGARGNLTGYEGGISKKIALLKLEKAYSANFFMPKHYSESALCGANDNTNTGSKIKQHA